MTELILHRLQARLGYTFNNIKLLQLALTHRSVGQNNNERLEFLGDSLLNLCITQDIFERFPEAREGQLSRLRADLVKGKTLAIIAREFELGECLRLGEGERKSGGRHRDSILADVVEAIIGAIFQDANVNICNERILAWYHGRLNGLDLSHTDKDSKTRLQEFLQSRNEPLPDYTVVSAEGEAHAQVFTIECKISLFQQTTLAKASNRREAEKQCAAEMLRRLKL